MKKILTALFAIALSLPVLAFAQSAQSSDQQQENKHLQQQQNQAAQVSENGSTTMPQHTMTGMVCDNGKSFTSNNTKYIVGNPDALKNYDNQNVSVVFQFNADRNKLHIVRVSPAGSQPQ
jgi:hypothetical protein